MPGKVNPVMAESLIQVCAQIVGNDATIGLSGLSGNFELNVMMPVMAHNLLQSVALLERSVTLFAQRCVEGLEADRKRCGELVERSLALVTALVPAIGYDRAAELAKRAHERNRTIREVVLEAGDLGEDELDRLLDPQPMTEAGLPGKS
jgi:fumarate hydratase class II